MIYDLQKLIIEKTMSCLNPHYFRFIFNHRKIISKASTWLK